MMSAELEGARQNAVMVEKISHRMSAEWMLAKSILLVIQHLEKKESQTP